MVGSNDAPDPAGAVTEELGLSRAQTMVAAVGVPQQRLVTNAILAVQSGESDAVLVLGGEAKASSLTARRDGTDPPVAPDGAGADQLLEPSGEFMAEAEVAASLWDPVTQYALIDSALARHEGHSPGQLLAEVSELWARFDAVAAGNPNAEFAGPPHTAAELAQTTEQNRLLAFPYNKWHSTQWALDHGAALLISAEAVALSIGLEPDSLLHPQVALDSSWGLSLSRRAEPHRWPMMELMGRLAEDHLGRSMGDGGLMELYSCFPAAVRVQQRALGLPLEGTPTVTGGMAFAGGPFNHFTYMATAELAGRLLAGEAELAALTTVSGMLTKGGLMAWGREPHRAGVLLADVAERAEAMTDAVTVAPWDPTRSGGTRSGGMGNADADRVVAATITGGFNPTLFAITEDSNAIRHVVSEPAPEGEPAEILATLGYRADHG
jgi:acetyl-CoA C-acetyltransferase